MQNIYTMTALLAALERKGQSDVAKLIVSVVGKGRAEKITTFALKM